MITEKSAILKSTVFFCAGMNSTTDLTPALTQSDVDIKGEYNNLTVSWSLSSAYTLPNVTVLYDITIAEQLSGNIILQQVC